MLQYGVQLHNINKQLCISVYANTKVVSIYFPNRKLESRLVLKVKFDVLRVFNGAKLTNFFKPCISHKEAPFMLV